MSYKVPTVGKIYKIVTIITSEMTHFFIFSIARFW